MTEEDATPRAAQPDDALRRLDRLVGTWQISGDASGQVRYEWLEGGFFLLQHVALEQGGERTTGLEVIGRERPYGASEPSEAIRSRYYDSRGSTLDYVYELDGDTLTIWFGERGSPAYYRGEFNAEGTVLTGAWVYPGGGYETSATKVG